MVAVKKLAHTTRSELAYRESKGIASKTLAGFIFVCNNATLPDLQRKIFGLPSHYADSVRAIHQGMPLFLFNYSTRLLYGIYEAVSDGGFNLDPYAWMQPMKSGRISNPVSKYPAQVKVRLSVQRPPLSEDTFRPVLDHYEGYKFRLELSADQVQRLFDLFGVCISHTREPLSERTGRPYQTALGSHDPESPVSAFNLDSDGCSECSSRGISFEEEWRGEDAWIQQSGFKEFDYWSQQTEDAEGFIAGSLGSYNLGCAEFYGNEPGVHQGNVNNKDAPLMSQVPYFSAELATIKAEYMPWKCHSKHTNVYSCSATVPSETDKQVLSRLHDLDPAVHSNSGACIQTGVQPLTVEKAIDVCSPPTVEVYTQSPSPDLGNVMYIPSQNLSNRLTGYSDLTVWPQQKYESSEQIKSAGGSLASKRLGFDQDSVSVTKDSKGLRPHYIPHNRQLPPQSLQSAQIGVGMVSLRPKKSEARNVQNQMISVSPVFLPPCGQFFSLHQPVDGLNKCAGSELELANNNPTYPDGTQNMWHGCTSPAMLMPSILSPAFYVASISFPTVLSESLHFDILRFAKLTRPSELVQLRVEAAVASIRDAVNVLWPEADVEVFGSFATGLCLEHSDIDLVVVGAPAVSSMENFSLTRVSALLVRELASFLKDFSWCESYTVIANATVPVLKCVFRPFVEISSVAVDITIGSMWYEDSRWSQSRRGDRGIKAGKLAVWHTGAAAREYVLRKILELPALAPLVLLLKSYLQHRGLSNVYSGGLGSFSLTLLLIFYLERVPIPSNMFMDGMPDDFSSVLEGAGPATCVQEWMPESVIECGSLGGTHPQEFSKCGLGEYYVRRAADIVDRVLSRWESAGSPYLGELLLGFLQSFGTEIDLSAEKIVLKGSDGSHGGMFKRDNRHVALWIDDPLRPGINVGAGSFAMCQVQDAFQEMWLVLMNQQFSATPLCCSEKDCQDLSAMGELSHLYQLLV